MAKRVFEIAKELDVASKAIVEKCKAEGIPNIKNHMSSVSIGLEATVKEWFSGGGDGGTATAVEETEKVDLEKVKAKPRPRRIAKKAAKKAARKVTDQTEPVGDQTTPATDATDKPDVVEAPSEPDAPVVEADGSQQDEAHATPAEPEVDPTEQRTDATPTPTATTPPAPPQPKTVEVARPNVPQRPTEVKPVGTRIEDEKKKPAKLSGPKVVRIEQPDRIPEPRSKSRGGGGGRGPGGPGAGPGPMGPQDFPPSTDTGRRNKRRGGGRDETPRDSGRGGRGGRGNNQGGGGVWRAQDLLEREQRLSRSEGYLRQRRRDQKMKSKQSQHKAETPAQKGGAVKVTTPLTIKDLSAATGVKAADIVKKLFMQGIMTNVNAGIEVDKAQEIMLDYDIDLQVEDVKKGESAVIEQFEQRETVDERARRPVVTILGHVDHGKTSLLDRIRNANVAAGEAGGITQATSAFLVNVSENDDSKQVCFLDTPGHEAFSEMRSRGATMTDIIVLVIAADDGVMPQTVESINHAKAAEVPLIVALNKIDLPGAAEEANLQKIYGQLAEHGLNPTAWGGDIEVVHTSAIKGTGIQELLELIDLTAQIQEYTADFGGYASGTVIESRMEEGRGAVANLLVQQGELKVGDFLVAGRGFGRVRDITNDKGQSIKSAGPSTPVQISGIDTIPDAGDKFYTVKTLKLAQEAAEQRRDQERESQLATPKLTTLDSMFAHMSEKEKKELLVVLKADVQGSVDAIRNSVQEISTDEINVRVLHAAVGGVTESDVRLAAASQAVIMGFNVIPSSRARSLAEEKGVEIRAYRVIYDIVDDVRKAAEGLLEPELREEVLGHAEVREVFKISKVGAVAGCYVTDGVIERNALIRVTRDDIVIEQDRVLDQLKRFKDDVKEVRNGQECGMKIVGYDDIKAGDILECFKKIEVKRTL
ncbi:MAG: translation initiation factor IF-2 [Phycisphaerales bacterium]